jgi:hypothetical protein
MARYRGVSDIRPGLRVRKLPTKAGFPCPVSERDILVSRIMKRAVRSACCCQHRCGCRATSTRARRRRASRGGRDPMLSVTLPSSVSRGHFWCLLVAPFALEPFAPQGLRFPAGTRSRGPRPGAKFQRCSFSNSSHVRPNSARPPSR